MNDVVAKFCDNVHEKLETLQGRLESLKLNIGATYHLLHEKVVEIRKAGEVRQSPMNEARASLEQWIELNAKLSADWPNITSKKDSPADADEHKGEEGKFDKYFSAEPGSGD